MWRSDFLQAKTKEEYTRREFYQDAKTHSHLSPRPELPRCQNALLSASRSSRSRYRNVYDALIFLRDTLCDEMPSCQDAKLLYNTE